MTTCRCFTNRPRTVLALAGMIFVAGFGLLSFTLDLKPYTSIGNLNSTLFRTESKPEVEFKVEPIEGSTVGPKTGPQKDSEESPESVRTRTELEPKIDSLGFNTSQTGASIDAERQAYAKAMRYIEEQLEEAKKSEEGQAIPWDPSNPRRVLLVTTWRSGSTFLGRLLSNYSAAFNHFEPLMFFDNLQLTSDHGIHETPHRVRQINTDVEKQKALQLINDLMHCRYRDEQYMEHNERDPRYLIIHNTLVWNACELVNDTKLCHSRKFLEESCIQFPVHTMKTVRLRLALIEEFLKDPLMSDIKIIYLIRDPRAVLNSRKDRDWCPDSPDCYDPFHLCSYNRMDLRAYKTLSQKYPGKIKLIKYETLATDPVKTMEEIYRFVGFRFTERIRKLVELHTSKHVDGAHSTLRKSSERVALWKTELPKENVTFIQEACLDVLQELGYALA